MKYLFAGLVISSVQILFMLAFTLFALSIGVVTLRNKFKPGKVVDYSKPRLPAPMQRQRRER